MNLKNQLVEGPEVASAPKQFEHTASNSTSRILRRPAVEARTGLSRSTIYSMMARGEFPQPIRLGLRAVGWRDTDVASWLASREPRGA